MPNKFDTIQLTKCLVIFKGIELKVYISSVITFVVTSGTAYMALLNQEGVNSTGDISQAAAISAVIGGVIAAANTLKAQMAKSPSE